MWHSSLAHLATFPLWDDGSGGARIFNMGDVRYRTLLSICNCLYTEQFPLLLVGLYVFSIKLHLKKCDHLFNCMKNI